MQFLSLPISPLERFQSTGLILVKGCPRVSTTPKMIPVFIPSEKLAIEPFFGIGWVFSTAIMSGCNPRRMSARIEPEQRLS